MHRRTLFLYGKQKTNFAFRSSMFARRKPPRTKLYWEFEKLVFSNCNYDPACAGNFFYHKSGNFVMDRVECWLVQQKTEKCHFFNNFLPYLLANQFWTWFLCYFTSFATLKLWNAVSKQLNRNYKYHGPSLLYRFIIINKKKPNVLVVCES